MVNVWKSFHEEVCKPSILLTTPVGILMVMTVESFDYFFLFYFEDLMCSDCVIQLKFYLYGL